MFQFESFDRNDSLKFEATILSAKNGEPDSIATQRFDLFQI